QAVPRGKPWGRKPVFGKMRREMGSVPGLRRPRGQLAPKRLSTRSFSEPRKAAGAGGVVTQNPRVECISCGWVSPFSAWGCGVGGRFCDANGSILRTPPVVWQPRVWDGYEGLEGCMHIADSRLALGREGFRFSGLGTIENKEEKKSQSWSRFVAVGSRRTLDPARRVHGRALGHGGLGPAGTHATRPDGGLL